MLIAGDQPLDTARYDAVVVGSGPVGLAVAMSLANAGRRTLVLETDAGGDDLAPSIGYGHFAGGYWNGHSIRALGGTSAVWSGWVGTLRDEDFDNPAVGVSWPITRGDLHPFYFEAAPFIDRDPIIVDYEKRLPPPWIYRPISIKTPTRFADKFREPLERSTDIDVALGCTAVGIDANARRSHATAVRYFRHGTDLLRTLPIQPAQALVVAGGGIGTPQLLLQPRLDGQTPVGNESGLVGCGLMEHPHFFSAATCVLDEDMARHRPPPEFGRYVHILVLAAARARELGLYGCSIDMALTDDDLDLRDYLATKGGIEPYVYRIHLRAEMRPSLRNRVSLTAESDRAGLRRPIVHCVLDACDFRNAELTLRELGRSLIESGRGRVRIENDLIYRRVRGGGHIMGTTRMGRTPSDSVVDRNCRVHGYDNFYLAGCSVFPTGGYANPTFTALALACRLAREIVHH